MVRKWSRKKRTN